MSNKSRSIIAFDNPFEEGIGNFDRRVCPTYKASDGDAFNVGVLESEVLDFDLVRDRLFAGVVKESDRISFGLVVVETRDNVVLTVENTFKIVDRSPFG